MTLFGKILVFINLALSVMMAAGAFALWTNRIDWSDRPAKGDNPAGLLAERQAEVKALWDGTGTPRQAGEVVSPYLNAEVSWRKNLADLEQKEQARPGDREWYTAELNLLRAGNKPVHEVVFAQGAPVLDPRNPYRPQMADAKDRFGNPLYSLAAYENQAQTNAKNITDVVAQYDKLIKEDITLTEKLIGKPGEKGLQRRVVEERTKREGVVAEVKLVQQQYTNDFVELDLVRKRAKSLDARIKELGKLGVASGEKSR